MDVAKLNFDGRDAKISSFDSTNIKASFTCERILRWVLLSDEAPFRMSVSLHGKTLKRSIFCGQKLNFL